jgi:flagellar biosynthetic protein FlhB
MAEDAGEKSQDATAHRRQQAREEGQVAQSQDMASALLLLGSALVLMYAGPGLIDFFGNLLAEHLGGDAWLTCDRDGMLVRWSSLLGKLAWAMVPMLGCLMLLGIGVHLMQVGFIYVPEKLAPDFSNVNPLNGFKRIFSLAGVVRLGFGMIKTVVVGTVAFLALYDRRNEILALAALEIPEVALFTWNICLWTAIRIGLALFVLGILDYGYQWWRQEQDMKMTSQEVREEMKNLQGDPQVISRRKQVQRQIAMQRLSSSVPKAEVVITNPTELAIAVQYDPATMNAPIVVAKGAGVVAARIRKLALENGITIVEKKPLAQALYKDVELNQPIPDQLYAAVAEVLAYVYQLKGKSITNTTTP